MNSFLMGLALFFQGQIPTSNLAIQYNQVVTIKTGPIIQITNVELTPCKGGTMPFGATGSVVVMFPPRYESSTYNFTVHCNGAVSVSPAKLGTPELDTEMLALVEAEIWKEYNKKK